MGVGSHILICLPFCLCLDICTHLYKGRKTTAAMSYFSSHSYWNNMVRQKHNHRLQTEEDIRPLKQQNESSSIENWT